MDPSRPAGHEKIETLDGLRGLAILVVVWFHTWQLSWLSARVGGEAWTADFDFIGRTGYVGVELFFFISAACLMLPVARRQHQANPLPLGEYAYRRAIKILPSYWLAIALCLVFRHAVFARASEYAWQLATHVLFIHDFFRETRNSIDGVFWSLAVEVQFYLVFPLLARGFLRKPVATALGMAACGIGFRYTMAWLRPHDLEFWMNLLPGYLDLFAAGMLAAWVFARPRPAGPKTAWTLTAIGASASVLWLLHSADRVRYEPEQPYLWQLPNRTWLAVGFLLIALASERSWPLWKKALANPALVFLSTISYNLYIWHQVLGRELIQRRIPASVTPDPHDDLRWKLVYVPLTLIASIAFAALITYLFERPLLRWRNPFAPRRG